MLPRNVQRPQDFAQNIHDPNQRDTDLTGNEFDAVDGLPPLNGSNPPRDFLTSPATPEGSTPSILAALLMEQNDYLKNIADYLRKQNADVLTQAVVQGAAQNGAGMNQIVDGNVHKVNFEIAGKPVPIYNLLCWTTWSFGTGLIGLSVQALGASVNDGIPLATNDVLGPLFLPTDGGLYVKVPSATVANPCAVNGPSDPVNGGFFIYGYSIPDWDDIRGAMRSMGGA